MGRTDPRGKRWTGGLQLIPLCCSVQATPLRCGGLRSHVINALMTNRSVIIVSRPVTFLGDPSRFVAMLYAIANLTLPQLGYADVIEPAHITWLGTDVE
jgi:hypothetical protein